MQPITCASTATRGASKVQVDRAIGEIDPDTVDSSLRFINVHYFAAGSTLFGTEAMGIYEFDGNEYLGRNAHIEAFDTCTECHNTHALTIDEESCFTCHQVESVEALRGPGDQTDYDGDGEVEGLALEIETLQADMLAALQAYVQTVDGAEPIAYNGARYPYWFIDANGNGTADADEGDGYNTFTPTSLIGAYNYQYVAKDPGAAAHNGQYVIQVLIDTIDALGGDTGAYTRP